MSVMYFVPDLEQIEEARNSTCGLATPKDSGDCRKNCFLYNGKPCEHYREPKKEEK